jgi:hypothetical protein
VARPEVKRQLGGPSCRRVDNIKVDLGEVEWGVSDWINIDQDRGRWRVIINTVMTIWVHETLGSSSVVT